MNLVSLNLVVLRASDIYRSAEFYRQIGVEFSEHQHGNGPKHLTAELSGSIFELYPLSQAGLSTLGTRIGFSVPSIDAVIAALSDYPKAVVSPPKESPWGRRAVIADPDGHRIELLQHE